MASASGAQPGGKPTGAAAAALAGDHILVHKRQRGNPVLGHVRSVPWRYEDIGGPDFVLGRGLAAVFVSLQYHLLHPRYATKRMRGVGREYRVKALLVQVDAGDNDVPLQELCRDAMAQGFVALLGWSAAEVARYVESFKAMEQAPAKAIMPRQEKGLRRQVMTALTTIRSVNRADADGLAAQFKTVAAVARAPLEAVQGVPGMGATKARRVVEALTSTFTALGPEAAARAKAGLPEQEVLAPQYSAAEVSVSRKRRRAQEDAEAGRATGAMVRRAGREPVRPRLDTAAADEAADGPQAVGGDSPPGSLPGSPLEAGASSPTSAGSGGD